MGRGTHRDRWKDRRVLAALVGATIVVVPMACAVAGSVVAEHLVPMPSTAGFRVVWFLAVVATSMAVFAAFDLTARRALPLKVLLRMGLVFPGRAPKRLAVAWRAASVRDLDRMVADARDRGIAASGVEATEEVAILAAALSTHHRKSLLKMGLALPVTGAKQLAMTRRGARVDDLDRMVADARARGITGETVDAAERIVTLAAALSAHDRSTRGHSERVRAVTDMIARELGLNSGDRDRLRWAALLHDIGKLAVHPDILNKSGELDEAEWAVIRQHPLEGAKLTAPLAGWLGPWADTIAEHHERFDGTGYPRGRCGHEISLGGRVVAVADAYDVMTATRTYKSALVPEAARRELAACAGSQFDPDVVRAFLAVSLLRLRLVAPLSSLSSAVVGRLAGVTRIGVSTARGLLAGLAVVGVLVGVTLSAPPSGARPAVAAAESKARAGAPRSSATTSTDGAGTASPGGDATTQGSGTGIASLGGAQATPTSPETPSTVPQRPRSTVSVPTTRSSARAGQPQRHAKDPSHTSRPHGSPASPVGVAARPGCGRSGLPTVSLSWSRSTLPVGSYVILRSANGTSFAPIATVSGATRTLTDAAVAPGATYWYEVRAVSVGKAATSKAVSDRTPTTCR